MSSWISVSPARLQFSINGNLLGSPFSAPFGVGDWEAFEANWNSGSSTSATISIINLNVAFGGNDYALDDIALAQTSVFSVPETSPLLLVIAGLGMLAFGRGFRPACERLFRS